MIAGDLPHPLVERIQEYVAKTDYVTFAELANRFGDEFRGGEHCLSKGNNTVLWIGMTEEAAKAVTALLEGGAIAVQPTSPLTYLIDGSCPGLPVAKQARRYKTPHWLPVTLRPAGKCVGGV